MEVAVEPQGGEVAESGRRERESFEGEFPELGRRVGVDEAADFPEVRRREVGSETRTGGRRAAPADRVEPARQGAESEPVSVGLGLEIAAAEAGKEGEQEEPVLRNFVLPDGEPGERLAGEVRKRRGDGELLLEAFGEEAVLLLDRRP